MKNFVGKFLKVMFRIFLVIFLCLLALIVIFMADVFFDSKRPSGEQIEIVTSPQGEYELEIWCLDGGATTSYAIEVWETSRGKYKLIYRENHKSEVKVDWITEDIVSIDGKKLDLSKGETYDWKKQ